MDSKESRHHSSVGRFHPFASSGAYVSYIPSVYGREGLSVVVVQQRSPVLKVRGFNI